MWRLPASKTFISCSTTTRRIKLLRSSVGSLAIRAFTFTSRPRVRVGSTKSNDSSQRLRADEFGAERSRASQISKMRSASTSSITTSRRSRSPGQPRRTPFSRNRRSIIDRTHDSAHSCLCEERRSLPCRILPLTGGACSSETLDGNTGLLRPFVQPLRELFALLRGESIERLSCHVVIRLGRQMRCHLTGKRVRRTRSGSQRRWCLGRRDLVLPRPTRSHQYRHGFR